MDMYTFGTYRCIYGCSCRYRWGPVEIEKIDRIYLIDR